MKIIFTQICFSSNLVHPGTRLFSIFKKLVLYLYHRYWLRNVLLIFWIRIHHNSSKICEVMGRQNLNLSHHIIYHYLIKRSYPQKSKDVDTSNNKFFLFTGYDHKFLKMHFYLSLHSTQIQRVIHPKTLNLIMFYALLKDCWKISRKLRKLNDAPLVPVNKT